MKEHIYLTPTLLSFCKGAMFVSVVSCASLHAEQMAKAKFWDNTNFYGLDVSS